jgi:hypothetical protein
MSNYVNVKGVRSVYHRLVNIRSGNSILCLSTLSINGQHVSLFVVIVKTTAS